MKLTLENVFAQEQSDKRTLTNRIIEVENDVNISLRKIGEMYTAIKLKGAECLSVCEVNQIIDDYFAHLNYNVSAIDQGTLGSLTFTVTDEEGEEEQIIVSLCPHVTHCETDTSLAKSITPLRLVYSAEDHTDTVDLTDWFVANNVIWSGNNTGRPQNTTQGIIDEVILGLDESIDCLYFTGSGGSGAFNLSLDDLTDVNTTGAPINVGDYLRFDGNNWVPTTTSGTFACSMLVPCSVDAFGDVDTTGAALRDVLTYNGSAWRPLNLSSVGNKVLTAREKFADTTLSVPAASATYSLTLLNPSAIPMTVMYSVSFAISTATDDAVTVTGTATIDTLGSAFANDYQSVVTVGGNSTSTAIYDTATAIPLVDFKNNVGTDTTLELTIALTTNPSGDPVSIKNVQIAIIGISTLSAPKSIA